MHREGPQTEIAYQLAWARTARTALKAMGLLANSSRGVWALTEDAVALINDTTAAEEQRRQRVDELWAEWQARLREARKGSRTAVDPNADNADVASEEVKWKEQLLVHLLRMQPEAFERLAKRLPREAAAATVVTACVARWRYG